MIMLSDFRNHRNYNISRLKSKMYAHGFQKMFTSKHFRQATFPTYTAPGTILVREGFASLELSREGVADISLFYIFLH